MGSILASVFQFFLIRWKSRIHCTGHSFRRFYHPKTSHFQNHFSSIFRVFFGTLPGMHFCRQKHSLMLKFMILGPPLDFHGTINQPFGSNFRPQNRLLASVLSHRSLPGPTLRSTTPQNHPRSHFDWFVYLFYLILAWILIALGWFWRGSRIDLLQNFRTTSLQTIFKQTQPGGMRVSDWKKKGTSTRIMQV